MSKIISIGTAVPAFRHEQPNIFQFMQRVFALNDEGKRKLRFLYNHSGIDYRYSVISDYSKPVNEWKFYPHSENIEPFPSLEQRMIWFNRFAAPQSVDSIRNCLNLKQEKEIITHLITVSCTGMSAPGLDLQIMQLMDLPNTTYHTSVNFMGCYAGIHALKMADSICNNDPSAKVVIVCTELCTLHFQKEATQDNFSSSLLFGDGSAAALVVADTDKKPGVHINNFYSEVLIKGKKDMAWELSSSGFLMTLSSYIPELLHDYFEPFVQHSLNQTGTNTADIKYWCIHPGGKRILEAVHKSLHFCNGELKQSYKVLSEFGNMSSPTILFVLKEIMEECRHNKRNNERNSIFTAAFGPGLTMESFLSVY